MASLSDEDLHDLISKLNLDGIKKLLNKADVAAGSDASKETLAWRLLAAIRMGLYVLPTLESEDRQVLATKKKKLQFKVIGITVTLPHPLTSPDNEWDNTTGCYPNVTETDVQQCEYILPVFRQKHDVHD